MKQPKKILQKYRNIYRLSFFILAMSVFSIVSVRSPTSVFPLQHAEYKVAGQETKNGKQEIREQGQETQNGYRGIKLEGKETQNGYSSKKISYELA